MSNTPNFYNWLGIPAVTTKEEALDQKLNRWRDEISKKLNPRPQQMPGYQSPADSTTPYYWIQYTYPDHVIACKEDHYYWIDFDLDDDGHIGTLGKPQEVEMTWSPKSDDTHTDLDGED